jgi:DNA-binding response OmpR family regulator/nitrogen-specific signal transduction histidine kinase
VLLVDDDPLLADVLGEVLEAEGYQVLTARGGVEGLRLLHAYGADVVCLDVALPDMDGYAFCRRVRTDPAIAHVPVLMLTARADPEQRLAGFAAGADDYVTKPFNLEELLARVRALLRIKQGKDELRQQNAELQAILESVGSGICVVDRAGIICRTNSLFAELFGLNGAAIVGRPYRDLWERALARRLRAPELFLQSLASSSDGGPAGQQAASETSEWELTGPSPRVLRRYSGPVYDDQGQRIGRVEVYTDITEARRAQEQLIQAEKLRALGEMASGVAHDFNNLLAGIISRAETLLTQVADPGIRAALGAIQQAAVDGAATVRRIQDYTRHRTDTELEACDLAEIARAAIGFAEPRWKDAPQRAGITIAMHTDLQPAPVAAVPAELREVVVNLLFNAVDAMPRGGVIRVRTWAKGSHAYLSVSDTGTGMPDEVRHRIFDPFYSTKGSRGSGLGLWVSQEIIKRHGGCIEVQTAPGEGSTFIVALPKGHLSAPGSPAAPQPARPRRLHILAIDDEPELCRMMARLLAPEGHEVTICASGAAGIAEFERSLASRPYDLVLTDLGMPEVNGWAVARAVKAAAPDVPVILVTGWGAEVAEAELQANGVDAVLPKPYRIAELRGLLARFAPPA